MKFTVVMKTPDVLDRAVKDALLGANPSLGNHELKDEAFALKEVCEEWFRYGEMVTLEIDTEARTCRVVPNTKR